MFTTVQRESGPLGVRREVGVDGRRVAKVKVRQRVGVGIRVEHDLLPVGHDSLAGASACRVLRLRFSTCGSGG